VSRESGEWVNAFSPPPILPSVKRLSIWNWWMGSISGSVLPSPAPAGRPLSVRWIQRVRPDRPRCPHHVENARGEAEQQKYDHPQRRRPEPAVEKPAATGPNQDTSNHLSSQP